MHIYVFNKPVCDVSKKKLKYIYISLFKVYRAFWLWAYFHILLLETRQNL